MKTFVPFLAILLLAATTSLVESHAALVRSLSRDDLGSIAAYLVSTADEPSPTSVSRRNSKPTPQ
jgi:hypothetical protein